MDWSKRIMDAAGGAGGYAIVILGSEKTAVFDGGMAFCADKTVENIKKILDGRTLDYVFVSHTHYDHIGALPAIRQAFPQVVAVGAAHGQKVLQKESVRQFIEDMSRIAGQELGEGKTEFPFEKELLFIDRAVKEGDVISLGDLSFTVMETPGHTRCSLSYYEEKEKMLLASETMGVMDGEGRVLPTCLVGCQMAKDAISRCETLGATAIYSPHQGMLQGEQMKDYWKNAWDTMGKWCRLVEESHQKGMTKEQMVDLLEEKYFPACAYKQTRKAFRINAGHMVDVMLAESRGI